MEKRSLFKTAIGLEYEAGTHDAPIIGVKGENLSADEVVKIAKRYGIPVVEKPELARALSALEVEDQVPEDLFEAIALVLHQVKKTN